jgi:hypothetical protein
MKTRMMMLCLVLGTTSQAAEPNVASTSSPSISASIGMIAFPARGQTPESQRADESACYAWSQGQTGFNPAAPAPAPAQAATAPTPAAAQPSGARVKGAVRGAAAGAVIGEVADNDAGQGAAIGATAGAVTGARQNRQQQQAAQKQQQAAQKQAAEQQAAQQQAARQQQMDLFRKGFAACMEPKGYTVR